MDPDRRSWLFSRAFPGTGGFPWTYVVSPVTTMTALYTRMLAIVYLSWN
jgi:hypothetical protein